MRLAHLIEPITQVVRITVKKTLTLNEIDKHQAIKHDRRVPLAVGHIRNPFHETEKYGMFLFKSLIESLGYALDIEGCPRRARNVGQSKSFFFFETECNVFQ